MNESAVRQNYVIGIDLGTSVIKSALYDNERVSISQSEHLAPLEQPAPGIAEQSAEEFVKIAAKTIREVVARAQIAPNQVDCLSFDGQMGGAIGVDQEFKALTPWYPSGLDSRYLPYQQQLSERGGAQFVKLCGDLPITAPRMLWWRQDAPELYHRIVKVVTLSGYVVAKMTGLTVEEAFIDPSYLTWTGLSDTARGVWSPELAEITDLGTEGLDKLPRIVKSTTVVGYLSPETARFCGLTAGIPVVAGAGDQAAGFLGAGMDERGCLVDVAGTFPVFGVCLSQYFSDQKNRMLKPVASPLGDNCWYSMMYINGGGLTHRWFAEHMSETNNDSFKQLDAAAAEITEGAEGLFCVPHLMGRACPNQPDIRGAWIGFTWTHRRPHFYRALLESIAYEYALALRVVKEVEPNLPLTAVRVVGGGAISDLWNQIKADVTGLPYERLRMQDASTRGSAMIAHQALGILPSTSRRIAQSGKQFLPCEKAHQRYQVCLESYRVMIGNINCIFDTLPRL